MDKSSITWTRGSDWWLLRMTVGGNERYPKQIRVGDLDRPHVYYPVDRDALLELADDLDYAGANVENVAYIDQAFHESARRIREACGAVDAG